MRREKVSQSEPWELQAVGDWLKGLRLAVKPKISQNDLGQLIGVSGRTILEAEAGRYLPHGLSMLRYVKALGACPEVPTSLPQLGRLGELEDRVERVLAAVAVNEEEAKAVTEAREELAKSIRDVNASLTAVLSRLERVERQIRELQPATQRARKVKP